MTVLEFKRKPEVHNMAVSKDGDWVVWHCDTCSRKVKTNIKTNEMVFERQGDFHATHFYQ
jgi:hypothetical protein